MSDGSLIVVGTGIRFAEQITGAAQYWIEKADKVLFVVDNPAAAAWLQELNPTAETLRFEPCQEQKLRLDMYNGMVECILSHVRQGLTVCAVFYGHPGVFVCPAHDAIRQARQEGFKARMHPAISAIDCLFADLDLDPAQNGCQSFDATDFLIHQRKFDTSSDLILWQIAMVGDPYYQSYDACGLPVLIDVLAQHYGPEHEVIVYEAALDSSSEPIIQRMPLIKLSEARITATSMLYVPLKAPAEINLDMVIRLVRARSPSR